MNVLGTNWKTNVGAVGVILSTVGTILAQVANGTFVFDATTIGGLSLIASIVWGFFASKDNNVTGGTVKQSSIPG